MVDRGVGVDSSLTHLAMRSEREREREIEAIHKWTKAVHSMQLPTQAQAWRRKSWGWAYGRQVSGRRLLSHPFGHALPKAERDRGRDDRDRDIHAPFLAKNRLTARALS